MKRWNLIEKSPVNIHDTVKLIVGHVITFDIMNIESITSHNLHSPAFSLMFLSGPSHVVDYPSPHSPSSVLGVVQLQLFAKHSLIPHIWLKEILCHCKIFLANCHSTKVYLQHNA